MHAQHHSAGPLPLFHLTSGAHVVNQEFMANGGKLDEAEIQRNATEIANDLVRRRQQPWHPVGHRQGTPRGPGLTRHAPRRRLDAARPAAPA